MTLVSSVKLKFS